MKNIVGINLGTFGSTGNIMRNILSNAIKHGFMVYASYPNGKKNFNEESDIIICSELSWKITRKIATITGFNGCFGYFITKNYIRKLKKIKPDIVHLHNLHNSYINLPLLFQYIKKHNIPVIWTLHDCWAFTGQCPHFTMVKCDKWKTGCYHCPQYREYPASNVDRTKTMWKLKRKWFTGVPNLTIITPSQWLADLVKQSLLKNYPVKVINNGIDLSVFKPTPSNFREKYNLNNKFIVLGVAFGWGKRKGLDVFIELSKRLDPNKYQIVLVGTDNNIDAQLPSNILSIHRTQNQTELAEIYTVADILANPTREENYPTVNMESIACGTPVLTFRTGGSPEIVDENTGFVVDCDDIDAMEREIIRICNEKPYSEEACLNKAKGFDMNNRYEEYITLYEEVINDKYEK